MIPVEANVAERRLMQAVLNGVNGNGALTMVTPLRLWAAINSVKYVVENNIDGEIVECGVWRGGCSIAMAYILKILGSNKKVYLYDTYSGMTKPGKYDAKFPTKGGKVRKHTDNFDIKHTEMMRDGYNEWNYASLEDVKNNFEKFSLTDYAIFVKGDVSQTLTNQSNLPSNGISLLRLDTDFYDSTKIELQILYPILSVKGVCLLDDYGSWKGQKKAVDEYFSQTSFVNRNPLLSVTDEGGRCLIKI